MAFRESYERQNFLQCKICNANVLAANKNQKYCASCVIDRMKQRKNASNARAKAKRLAARAAINGPENRS